MAASAIQVAERRGARIGLLVHDLLPATQPRWFADAQGRAAKRDVESLIAAASQLFAVSPEVAAELESRYGKRAAVIQPAEPPLRRRESAPARGEYVLYVGTLHPRKNLAALVEIWSRWSGAPKLIIAGRRHPQDGPLFQAIAAAGGARTNIELRHDVDDAGLAELYAGARFLVLPSLAEGWGLPVREAFAAGRPAIATDAVPAALGSPFAKIVPAADTVALEAALRTWWESDTPEQLSARLQREFTPRTWRDCGDELLASLRSSAD
jgi:glycosyltransferase involved in cell wall biosynthesis